MSFLRRFSTILLVTVSLIAALPACAQFSCPTSDDVAVQAMLDAAAASGGGTVQLDPRVYTTCQALILGSNVHLRGAGRGVTIIRGSTAITGKTVNNAYVGSTIGAVGTTNMSVSDLTIDHATYARNANGISFLPKGTTSSNTQLYDGAVPTNGLIQRVEILGTPGLHAYMIWNLRGQHMKIDHNWVDGGDSGSAVTNSGQVGIETFGGYDVMISDNTVQNIGSEGINIGSSGLTNTETVGVIAMNNYMNLCTYGVNIGTSNQNGGQSNSHTHIEGNVITNSRLIGILVQVMSSSYERDLEIAHNSIRLTGLTTSSQAAGISLQGIGPSALVRDSIVGTTVEANDVDTVQGTNANGIRLMGYPNAGILNNTIVDTAHEGIWVADSTDVEIVGNRIERAAWVPISVAKSNADIFRLTIERNMIADWSNQTAGVLVVGGHTGAVRDNTFKRLDTAQPSPIVIDQTSCGMTVTGNLPWYSVSWQNTSTAACP